VRLPRDSSFVPEAAELDVLVELAFEEPDELIASLQELPSENPFSEASTVDYEQRSDLARTGIKAGDNSPASQDQEVFGRLFGGNKAYKPGEADFDITPFSAVFQTSGNEPGEDHVIQAVLLTLAYLNDYLKRTFDAMEPGAYITLLGAGQPRKNDPRQIGFMLGIKTAEGFRVAAPQSDVDMVVAAAFRTPFVEDLVAALRMLPASNPFSTTTIVQYRALPADVSPRTNQSGEISTEKAEPMQPLLIASLATLSIMILAVIGMAISLYRSRQRQPLNHSKVAPLFQEETSRAPEDLLDIISNGSSQHGAVFRNESLSSGIIDADYRRRDSEVIEFDVARTFIQERGGGDPLFRSSWSINEEFMEQEQMGALHAAHRVSSAIPSGSFRERDRVDHVMDPLHSSADERQNRIHFSTPRHRRGLDP